jgi:acyl carrier protein
MPNQKEIMSQMAEILGLSVADLDKESDLREDLNLGPLELNDLVNQLSNHFDVVLDPEELSGVKTVDDLVILIEDNLI